MPIAQQIKKRKVFKLYYSNKNNIKNDLVNYVFDNEKNFFSNSMLENSFEDFNDFAEHAQNYAFPKSYFLRFGKRETNKMLREAWDEYKEEHDL